MQGLNSPVVPCSTNPADQNKATSELVNTATTLLHQLTPATPSPTPATSLLSLPAGLSLPSLLGAVTGQNQNSQQQQPTPQQQPQPQQLQQQQPSLASFLPGNQVRFTSSYPTRQAACCAGGRAR